MRTFLLLLILLLPTMANLIYAQPLQVVASSGGNITIGDKAIEWTLGETVIATLSSENIILSQGFHQPILTVTTIKTPVELAYKIEAYPNPTNDLLLIRLENADAQEFQYILYDINGKVLEQKELKSNETAINMTNNACGEYLLKIIQTEKEIMTFKIIKK